MNERYPDNFLPWLGENLLKLKRYGSGDFMAKPEYDLEVYWDQTHWVIEDIQSLGLGEELLDELVKIKDPDGLLSKRELAKAILYAENEDVIQAAWNIKDKIEQRLGVL